MRATRRTIPAVFLACAALLIPRAHTQPTNGGYVEPGLCAECHRAIAESYSRTGMARSFGVVSLDGGFSELNGGSFHHEASAEFFSVFARDGKAVMRRQQLGVDGSPANVVERNIDYWFGSGAHARSYISRTVSKELIELPLTWYAEMGGHWGMSPAYDFSQHAGFSRKITYRCMFCHNGYPDFAAGADRWETDTRFPVQLPSGIDCQRCHGPGRDHIETARLGRPAAVVRGSIVNPARLAPVRQTEICLQCHLETTNASLPGSLLRYGRGVFSYRPGEPLGDYMLFFDHAPGAGYDDKFEFTSAPYRLRKSRCYLESRGALTCTTCHNPHQASDGPGAAARYTRVCQSCHAAAIERLVRQERHPASANCVSCHMLERRPSDAIHVRVTDHYIRRSPDRELTGPLVERNGSNTPPYRGKVVLYYPDTIAEPSDRDLYVQSAQIKNQANVKEGLTNLERAIAKFRPARGEFYSDLADAYRQAGHPEKAVALYREACARDPQEWPAFFGLGIALANSGDFGQAATALKRALSIAPWQTEIVKSLAGVLADAAAITTLRAAVAADPDSGDLRNNLGAALTRAGDLNGAEEALREAVRFRPEMAAIRVNLASLVAQRGRFPEARYEFEEALRIDNSSAEAHSAYGTALAAHGDWNEARNHFQAALARNPGLWNTHNNLGILLLQSGDMEGAIREYRAAIGMRQDFPAAHYNLGAALAAQGRVGEAEQHLRDALRIAPDYYEAHLKLGQLLCAQNRCDKAAPHLRKAARSIDPKVRQASLDALKKAE
jgi:predicted CXXCH cytochrome family protein